jgi:hypothetical protein
MTPNELREWVLLGVMAVGWLVSIAVMWTKLVNKVNGLGGRVDKTEETCSTHGGRSERMEREIAEHRRDVHDAIANMARVEKGVGDLKDEVTNGNLAIGVQLHAIEKLMNETAMSTTNRLVRLETIQGSAQEK